MLTFNTQRRISASQALLHPFFSDSEARPKPDAFPCVHSTDEWKPTLLPWILDYICFFILFFFWEFTSYKKIIKRIGYCLPFSILLERNNLRFWKIFWLWQMTAPRHLLLPLPKLTGNISAFCQKYTFPDTTQPNAEYIVLRHKLKSFIFQKN